MRGWKKFLTTTAIWLMMAIAYVLTFFCEKDGVVLGDMVAITISGLTIGRLWHVLYKWLYDDEEDT